MFKESVKISAQANVQKTLHFSEIAQEGYVNRLCFIQPGFRLLTPQAVLGPLSVKSRNLLNGYVYEATHVS